MPTSDPCPVCGTEMKTYHDTGEGITYESGEECPKGCYEYSFAYGNSMTRVGDHDWHWHHTETTMDYRKRRVEIDKAIQEMKEQHANN